MKITFLFNQLTNPYLGSGGDIKGYKIYDQARQDSDLHTSVITPYYSQSHFSPQEVTTTGHTLIEKSTYSSNIVASYLIAYFMRTIETIRILQSMNTDVVYCTGDFFCNVIPAYWYKKKNPATTFVACIYHLNESPRKRKNNFLFRSILSFLMQQTSFYLLKRHANIIFVLNHDVKEKLSEMGFQGIIVVSRAGVDVEGVKEITSETRSPQTSPKLLFVNRANPTKGVHDLPSILSTVRQQYPTCTLDLVGSIDPSMKKDLEDRFENQGCAHGVTFHGFVKNKKEVLELMSSSDVFLQPSYEEGWSIVLFEAILSGCMPVVYDLPVYKETFNETLFTATIGDHKEFAGKILEVLELNDSEHQAIIEQLQQVAEKYDWDQVYHIEKKALQHSNL